MITLELLYQSVACDDLQLFPMQENRGSRIACLRILSSCPARETNMGKIPNSETSSYSWPIHFFRCEDSANFRDKIYLLRDIRGSSYRGYKYSGMASPYFFPFWKIQPSPFHDRGRFPTREIFPETFRFNLWRMVDWFHSFFFGVPTIWGPQPRRTCSSRPCVALSKVHPSCFINQRRMEPFV